MRRRALGAAILIGVIALSAPTGSATVLVGDVFKSASGRVAVNLFSNHYIPADWVFPAVHTAEALDVVRAALARESRIKDVAILVWDGWFYNPTTPHPRAIEAPTDDTCVATFGETGRPEEYLGPCYTISPKGGAYQDMLAMAVALPELSAGISRLDIEDPEAFRTARSPLLRRFDALSLHFDPVWSPDGSRLLYTVWEPEGVRLEFVDAASGAVTRLPAGGGELFARALWSEDGRFIAYASQHPDVRLYDTRTKISRTIAPRQRIGELRILLLFEAGALHIAFRGGNDFESYVYGLSTGDLRETGREVWPQARMARAERYGRDVDAHGSLRPVRSPTGSHVAIFTFSGGQRRIRLKSLQ